MDEVKAGSLFEKVILPLRDDEYLDGDGFPRCKSCHTLRVYVSDDKTFCARCLCKCQSDQIEKEKELEAIRRNLEEFYDRQRLSLFMTVKGFLLWVTGIRIVDCQRQL